MSISTVSLIENESCVKFFIYTEKTKIEKNKVVVDYTK